MKRFKFVYSVLLALAMFGLNKGVTAQDDYSISTQIISALPAADATAITDAKATRETAEAEDLEADKILADYKTKKAEAEQIKRKRKKRKALEKIAPIGKEGIQKKMQAANKIYNANSAIYNAYSKNITSFKAKTTENNQKEGEMVEKEATSHFEQGTAKRQEAASTKGESAFTLLSEAKELEMLAIEELEIAYDIYLNWQAAEEKIIDQGTGDTDSFAGFDGSGDAGTSRGTKRSDYKPADGMVGKRGVFYKVQIIATRKELTRNKLKRVYESNQIINNELADGLYKYSVGMFDTYEEAAGFRDKIKVKGAFVVAYNGAERIDIKEAIKMEKK